MKNILYLTFVMLLFSAKPFFSYSQKVDTTINLLKAPSSPASNLLGIAQSDIEKPTDLKAIMISLRSNTSGFTKLPSNYAIDFAPFLLSRARSNTDDSQSSNGLLSKKFSDIVKQTLVISLAIRNLDSNFQNFKLANTYGAFGFKVSILRPTYIDKDIIALNLIYKEHDAIINTVNKRFDNSIEKIAKINKQSARIKESLKTNYGADTIAFTKEFYRLLDDTTSELGKNKKEEERILDEILKTSQTDYASNIRKLSLAVKSFGAKRKGVSIDLAGGTAIEFVNKTFNNSNVFNAGLWVSGGYVCETSNILGIIRYLYNPNQIFAKNNSVNNIANISTLDLGVRYINETPDSKFTCSGEAIYRCILNKNTIDPSWRLVVNMDYALWPNQKIGFSFGRDYNGVITKDGNLIAALNFITGFGRNF